MWKLITVAALAASVLSSPAFAQRTRHHTEYQQYQSEGGSSAVVPSSNAYGPNY